MADEIAVRAERLGKRYRLGGAPPSHVWALKDASFEVKRGEVLGVLGRNGAGKSTLLKLLARITDPSAGEAWVQGRVGSLLEVGTGFHPELSGRENVYLNGAISGMSRQEIARRFDEIVAFAEVERFLDQPVKRYSSGMAVRLAFAVAAHLVADVLLVDEVLAVGDVSFQRRCLGKMHDVARAGRTVLLVSHNLAAVASQCQAVMVLEAGGVAYQGPAGEGIERYLRLAGAGAEEPIALRLAALPANEYVRLDGFSVRQEGAASPPYGTRRPLAVEIEYEVLRPVHGLAVGFAVHHQASQSLVFRAFDEAGLGDRAPGVYRSRAEVPAGLLNEAEYRLCPNLGIYGWKWLIEEEVGVVVDLQDAVEARPERRALAGGVVRPSVAWTTSRRP